VILKIWLSISLTPMPVYFKLSNLKLFWSENVLTFQRICVEYRLGSWRRSFMAFVHFRCLTSKRSLVTFHLKGSGWSRLIEPRNSPSTEKNQTLFLMPTPLDTRMMGWGIQMTFRI
jgi:hypothetical protein